MPPLGLASLAAVAKGYSGPATALLATVDVAAAAAWSFRELGAGMPLGSCLERRPGGLQDGRLPSQPGLVQRRVILGKGHAGRPELGGARAGQPVEGPARRCSRCEGPSFETAD